MSEFLKLYVSKRIDSLSHDSLYKEIWSDSEREKVIDELKIISQFLSYEN